MRTPKKYIVTPEAIDGMKHLEYTGDVVHINGIIPDQAYREIKKIMAAHDAKWDTGKGGFACKYNLAKTINEIIDCGFYRNWKKDTEYYFTPNAVLEEMCSEISFPQSADIRILEPSAGEGRIVEYLKNCFPLAHLTAVEISPRHIPKLEKVCNIALQQDFLSYEADEKYDLIVMNPPFSQGVEHVLHAYEMLAPDGELVAVLPSSIDYRDDKSHRAWRRFLEKHYSEIVALPKKSFAASGTTYDTVFVRLYKSGTTQYRYHEASDGTRATVEIVNVPDPDYVNTVCAVDIEWFLAGRRTFSTANDAFTLTDEMICNVSRMIAENYWCAA